MHFGSSGSKPFVVEAGGLIKIQYYFQVHFGSSGLKPYIVEAGDLISLGSKPFIG